MKYAVSYSFIVEEEDRRMVDVESEEFDSFLEAVEKYTQLCGGVSRSVVLMDLDNNQIIRQFAWRIGLGESSDAIFIT